MNVTYLELAGFRSFGADPERLDITSSLVVIHAENSQGKTSLAEAFEFLLTGATSRRQLGGGSPQEYSHAIRNVHIPSGTPVYVEAGIELNGQAHVIRRELTQDYEGASDLGSILTIDGADAEDVSGMGFNLAEPPISAPVLLEHALRYAVSAKPAERSEFFRAIVEATDLDDIRTTIDYVLSQRQSQPRNPLLAHLDAVRAMPAWSSLLEGVDTPTSASVAQALLEAMRRIVPRAASTTGADSLTEARSDVAAELARRQQVVFPANDLVPGNAPPPGVVLDDIQSSYVEAISAVDKSVADMLPVFRAVLGADLVAHTKEAIDCPVCQTPAALTPGRVQEIRREVAAREGMTAAQKSASLALHATRQQLAQVQVWLRTTLPRSSTWTVEQREKARQAFASLFPGSGTFDACLAATDALKPIVAATNEACQNADDSCVRIETQVNALALLGCAWDDAQAAIRNLKAVVAQLADDVRAAAKVATAAVQQVRPLLVEGSSTEGWQELVDLSSEPGGLAAAIGAWSREQRAQARLRAAQRAIVAATRRVLDQRLAGMADEIRKWWLLLRPDELTTFGDLTRRGAGNKMLDLTAALFPEPDMDGEIRSALAVLSTSQLNALGLSTFLARCILLRCDVVLLDDPVPGSDPEHRYGFADSVLGALLDAGLQVIIETQDPGLTSAIESLQGHWQPDEFGIAIVTPAGGSRFDRRGDDFEHLMLEADAQLGSPLIPNRKAAGNSLRTAAERLAKHIIVQARLASGETDVLISEYDGKNLRDLRPLVIQYVVQPNETGYWTNLARILNDADHDATPPQSADLRRCHQWLREIKRKHGVSTATGAPGGSSVPSSSVAAPGQVPPLPGDPVNSSLTDNADGDDLA